MKIVFFESLRYKLIKKMIFVTALVLIFIQAHQCHMGAHRCSFRSSDFAAALS